MSDARTVVGISDVDGADSRAALRNRVEAAGGLPLVAPPSDLRTAEVAAVVVADDASFRTLATAATDVPLLPVGDAAGERSVPLESLESTVRAVLDGEARTESHPVLDLRIDGRRVGRWIREASILTAEPARISEFGLSRGDEVHLDEVRADGVVVATPLGSTGYAGAGSSPVLAPGTGLAVVPVAPFRIDPDRWIVPVDPVTVTVQREETDVAVELDGVDYADVGRDAVLSMAPVDAFEVFRASTPSSSAE